MQLLGTIAVILVRRHWLTMLIKTVLTSRTGITIHERWSAAMCQVGTEARHHSSFLHLTHNENLEPAVNRIKNICRVKRIIKICRAARLIWAVRLIRAVRAFGLSCSTYCGNSAVRPVIASTVTSSEALEPWHHSTVTIVTSTRCLYICRLGDKVSKRVIRVTAVTRELLGILVSSEWKLGSLGMSCYCHPQSDPLGEQGNAVVAELGLSGSLGPLGLFLQRDECIRF